MPDLRSTNEIFNEPWLSQQKQQKKTVPIESPQGSGIIVFRSIRFVPTDNQTPPRNSQIWRIEINSVLPLCLGNTARHPQFIHPSADELNPQGGISGKKASSWIHPHSHGRTRGHLKKGELKRFVTRLKSSSFSNETGCCLSKWKIKIGLRKIFRQKQQKIRKRLEMLVNFFYY
jgi:hypothetical protein